MENWNLNSYGVFDRRNMNNFKRWWIDIDKINKINGMDIGDDSLDEVDLGNCFFVEPCQCLMYLDTKSLEKYS